jgi:hypothetical protein
MEEYTSMTTAQKDGAAQNTPSKANATTDVPVTRLEHLQKLLRLRLPQIRRWMKVDVYYDNTPDYYADYKPGEGCFIIIWNGTKGRNIHPFEIKEIPFTSLENYIIKTENRLKNETKTYK